MDWTAAIRKELHDPCYDRPFVCDGKPDAGTVIIVGENPGRITRTNWWSYWTDEGGFDFASFTKDYEAKGQVRGSRLRFNRVRQMWGINAVETNFYRDEGLGGSQRHVPNTKLIQLLVDNMPGLKAVVFHGGESQALAGTVRLPKAVRSIPSPHFRGIGYDALDSIFKQLK